MDKQAAYDLVVEYLTKHFSTPREHIKPEARLFEDLRLDSIDALDMLALLDRRLNIKLNEEQATKIRTVQDVVDYMVANVTELPEHVE
jgi:acyl carrier protein